MLLYIMYYNIYIYIYIVSNDLDKFDSIHFLLLTHNMLDIYPIKFTLIDKYTMVHFPIMSVKFMIKNYYILIHLVHY